MPNLEAHPADTRTDKESSHLWITPGCFHREMNCKLENIFQWFESPFADIRCFHGLSMASSNQNLAPNDEDSKMETEKEGSGPVQIDLQTQLIRAGEVGSDSERIATKARGPESGTTVSLWKPPRMGHTCNPSPGGAELGGSLGLAVSLEGSGSSRFSERYNMKTIVWRAVMEGT